MCWADATSDAHRLGAGGVPEPSLCPRTAPGHCTEALSQAILAWAETRANLREGQGDAPEATVRERARGGHTRGVGRRDNGGGGGRTVAPCAWHSRRS